MHNVWSYSISVFIIILLSGCIVNLLKQHFIIQLTGIAFFFTYVVLKVNTVIQVSTVILVDELYSAVFPGLMGISACLISMAAGFWLFPPIRKKMKD